MIAAATARCSTPVSKALPAGSRLACALAGTAALVCGLAACQPQVEKGPISGDAAKVVMASPGPSSSNPLVGVIPLDDTVKTPKSNSPADGTTAVGGLTSNGQGSGGGATGGTPAKTGGDGK